MNYLFDRYTIQKIKPHYWPN